MTPLTTAETRTAEKRTAEGPEDRAPLLAEALQRAQGLGFLGDGPLDAQVRHSLEMASCVEGALAAFPDASSDDGNAPSIASERSPRRFLDLGTGGGVPGLILAQRWGAASGVLLDAHGRRTEFVADTVRSLGWEDRIEVVRERAEVAGRQPELRGAFDVVVARSFGPPPVTAECGAPFLAPGGILVVSEPPAADGGQLTDDPAGAAKTDPVRWPEDGLGALGLARGEAWRRRFGFQVLRLVGPVPDRYPRRAGVPAKRPLYRVPRET